MDSRKTTMRRKLARKSSLPLENGTMHSSSGLCRPETIQVVLDCSQGSGLCLGPQATCGGGYLISQILPESVADR